MSTDYTTFRLEKETPEDHFFHKAKALITLIAVTSIMSAAIPAFASTKAHREWNEETQRFEFTLYEDDCDDDGVCLDPNRRQLMEEESQKDSFDLPDWVRNI